MSLIHIQSVIESAVWIIQVAFIAPKSIKASKLVVIDLISDSVWGNKEKKPGRWCLIALWEMSDSLTKACW